jgi:hypothetical protein
VNEDQGEACNMNEFVDNNSNNEKAADAVDLKQTEEPKK